jgi:hypothetical protein
MTLGVFETDGESALYHRIALCSLITLSLAFQPPLIDPPAQFLPSRCDIDVTHSCLIPTFADIPSPPYTHTHTHSHPQV